MKRFEPRSVIANLTRVAAISLLLSFVACSDDDSDTFLVRGGDTSYSNEEDEPESSSSRSSSGSERRSSSSSAYSSSSVNSSSSSKRNVAFVEPLRQNPDEDCDYGSLIDKRDGQVYKTVVIGEQTWMAENLNYAYLQPDSLEQFDSASACYNDSLEYCDKYGRLYSFDVIEKVCPDGWHLPSMDEWEVLFDAVGGINVASEKLISSYGWKNQSDVDDGYCFSVLPGGYRPSVFDDLGVGEGLWTSTWYDSDAIKNVYFYNNYSYAYEGYTPFEKMLYIRCVEDYSSSVKSSSSTQSSSSVRSSSSPVLLDTISYVPPCRDEYEDNCGYGSLVDERDGQSYRTVDIGEQTWMAENLKYVSEDSRCYNHILENCDVDGRLYPWEEAMVVCPSGWHLPSLDEWKILYTYAGGIYTSASKLRASYGWKDSNAEGTDDYGISILPGGYYMDDYGAFRDLYESAIFWTSTDYDYDEKDVYDICFDERDEIVAGHSLKTENLLSVRCLRD